MNANQKKSCCAPISEILGCCTDKNNNDACCANVSDCCTNDSNCCKDEKKDNKSCCDK